MRGCGGANEDALDEADRESLERAPLGDGRAQVVERRVRRADAAEVDDELDLLVVTGPAEEALARLELERVLDVTARAVHRCHVCRRRERQSLRLERLERLGRGRTVEARDVVRQDLDHDLAVARDDERVVPDLEREVLGERRHAAPVLQVAALDVKLPLGVLLLYLVVGLLGECALEEELLRRFGLVRRDAARVELEEDELRGREVRERGAAFKVERDLEDGCSEAGRKGSARCWRGGGEGEGKRDARCSCDSRLGLAL